MMEPKTLARLLACDPLAPVQSAIVTTLTTLLPGVRVVAHPGRVDLSELLAKSVATAPGIGVGWSRVRRAMHMDGSFGALVEWVAYVVAEARVVDGRRVEKEAVGLAIGGQVLRALADDTVCFWGRAGILPPEMQPQAELKPLFTVRDMAEGTAYYTVTWTQLVADIGETLFPTATGTANPEAGTIDYADPDHIAAIAKFLPARKVDGDA
ncbi:MAG: hypothetical protein M9905_17510 [Rhizobiaceae bacterium]|nr:hypothetical protein [Rhizobiaceae bacterium]